MLCQVFYYLNTEGDQSKRISKVCLALFIFGMTLFLAIVKQVQSQSPDSAIGEGDAVLPQKSEIFGLTVKSGKLPGYVSLHWQVRAENSSPIIVKRYSRPMSTLRLLLKGKQINLKTLEAQTKSYTDKLLAPGVYYYAVITEEELRTSARLALVEGGNYTHRAFIISELLKPADIGALTREKEHPQELIAVNTKKSVLLTWAPTNLLVKDLRYEIYRGLQPLDTKEALKKAKLLGKTKGSRPQFEDFAPLANRDVYYGVILSGALEWSDFKILELGKSYIQHRYIEELAEIDEIFALNIKGAVLLTWTPKSASRKIRYQIYRSLVPLDSTEALKAAKLIGTTKSHRSRFKDQKPLVDKDVYYGILLFEKEKEPELKGLILNKSYIKHRFIAEILTALLGKAKDSKTGIRGESLLDLILANSYLKGRYKQCIRQVSVFLNHVEIDEDTEAKGSFFLGLCHYKAKSYREAMEFFSIPLVKKKYPMRTRLWFERSVRRP